MWAMVVSSVVFLKKISSGTRSDPKFGRRGRCVSYINARKTRFRNTFPACVLLRKYFKNGVLARSITKIPPLLDNKKQVAGIPMRLCARDRTLRARGPFSEELGTAVRQLRSSSSS
jgi:hypothetical protein